MKRISAVAALALCSVLPCQAAPPTVLPSPGYDARLQESRTATPSPPAYRSVAPKPITPRRAKRRRLR